MDPTSRRIAAGSAALSGLRGELEALGVFLVGPAAAADAVGSWTPAPGPARLLAGLRRLPLVAVAPGPLASPYDGPSRGFASLRVAGLAVAASADRAGEAGAARALLARLGLADLPPGEGGEEAFARDWLDGVVYFDAWSRRPTTLPDAAEQVAWLRERYAGNRPRAVLVGVSRWKRESIDAFLQGPDGPPTHVADAARAVETASRIGGRVAAWATRMPAALPDLCARAGVPMLRMEDGFLRSVGLGASFQPGASIVLDGRGIYYDPRVESDLGYLLRTGDFPADLVAQAAALRATIVALRLSKYNVGLAPDLDPLPPGRRVVLVPGQVEDDASVLHGSPHVRSNRALLAAARRRNPDAVILYKPHPDVEAGFRPGRIEEAEALTLADRIVGGLSIVELLDRVDHLETMTSLAGFEALLRGRSVAVHGRPFYAGWGLTEDLAPGADRGRTLTLDELVAGALLRYPLYLDPVTLKPCPPERLLGRLAEARAAAPASALALTGAGWLAVRARYALLNPLARLIRTRRGVPGAPTETGVPTKTVAPRKSR